MGENQKKIRILVVEDEPDIMELVKVTLSDDAYQLLEAMDGELILLHHGLADGTEKPLAAASRQPRDV